jgi:lipoprotein-releasing system permease protein
MGYELFIARRYLTPKRSQLFVSLTTLLTTLGVTIGVAALIIVLSGMNGFANEILKQLTGMNAHFWVQSFSGTLTVKEQKSIRDQLKKTEGVVGMSPTVYEEAFILTRLGRTGTRIKGVEPKTIAQVSNIVKYLEDSVKATGSFNLKRDPLDNVPGIVMGWQLAGKIQAGVGDLVYIVSPQTAAGAMTMLGTAKMHKFRLNGVFTSGFFEFDAAMALIDIHEAQRVFGLGDNIGAIEVKLKDQFAANETATSVVTALGGYPIGTTTWIDLNGGLYKWLMIEKWFAFIILSLIILVAAFNIISTLTMVVLDKTREIGILKTMGATSNQISRIFLMQGLFVGVIGTAGGGVLGYILCWVQDTYHIVRLPADLYQVSAFPVLMDPWDFVAIASVTMLICILSAAYPGWRASKLDPVEAIRHD